MNRTILLKIHGRRPFNSILYTSRCTHVTLTTERRNLHRVRNVRIPHLDEDVKLLNKEQIDRVVSIKYNTTFK